MEAKRDCETLFFLKRKQKKYETKRNEKNSETERKLICKVVKRNGTKRNETENIITFHKPWNYGAFEPFNDALRSFNEMAGIFDFEIPQTGPIRDIVNSAIDFI
jgi:hypothetical protein